MSISLEWEYSRNQRRHTAFDHHGNEAFWIKSEAPYRQRQSNHGYRLQRPDGAHIQFAKTVKLLKQAAERHNKGEPS